MYFVNVDFLYKVTKRFDLILKPPFDDVISYFKKQSTVLDKIIYFFIAFPFFLCYSHNREITIGGISYETM